MPYVASTTVTATTVSTTVIWSLWNSQYSSDSILPVDPLWTPSATNSSAIATYVDTAVNSTSIIWTGWVQDHARLAQASAEEVRQAQENRQRYEAERVRIESERGAAKARAEMLLQENLSDLQKAELKEKGFFSLQSISKEGQIRHYRIKRGIAQNINEIDPGSGKVLKTICAHPNIQVPEGDAMLVQKFMLEDPESHDQFMRIANIRHH